MLSIYRINNKNYYFANQLKQKCSSLFKGCNTTRKIIIKHKIPENEYLFGKFEDDKFIKYSKNYKKANLYLSKNYVDLKILNKKSLKTIHLNKDQHKYNINIKGERNINASYFNTTDVEKEFNLKNLKNIIPINNFFHENIHYIYLEDELYLTYKGLVKVLYYFNSNEADEFQDWAYNDFFNDYILEDSSLKSVQTVLGTCVQTIPCIYLFKLGSVKDLQKTFDIQDSDDDFYVYKYGMTKNLSKRTYQHSNYYGKMDKVDLSLKMYAYLDPLFTTEAENYLRTFFNSNDMQIIDDKYNELVIIPKDKYNLVKEYFELISCKFGATLNEIKNENIFIKNELNMLKKDMEIQRLNYENVILKNMK
jgi:hypothetical protein